MNKFIATLLLLLTPTFSWALSDGSTITTMDIVDQASTTTANYPLTFGHVFKEGDIPTGKYVGIKIGETTYTTQCEIKTAYDDGSVRFAIISTIIPVTADSTTTLTLYVATSAANTGQMTESEMLATNIENEIRLTNLSDSGLSGSLTADLSASIDAANFEYWRSGSVCTEVLVRESLNNQLKAYWEVRFFPTTSFGIRVSASIENMETQYRGQVGYDLDIQAGTPTLSSQYSESSIIHYPQGRWRKVFWVGTEPPEVEIRYDVEYLIATKMLPNLDTSITPTESKISSLYSTWTASDRSIMGLATYNSGWGATGAWFYIGIIGQYEALYLLSMDNRLREMIIEGDAILASAPFHWRESDNTKSNYGAFLTIDDHPNVWTSISNANNSSYENLGAWLGTSSSQWVIERAHNPINGYLPYIITGDHFHLEELQYKAANELSMCDPSTVFYGRHGSTGRLYDETRGVAWSFRDLVRAATLSLGTAKTYFSSKVTNNIEYFNSMNGTYPLNYWKYDSYASKEGMTADVKYITAPWQNDFLLLSFGHAKELGFSIDDTINWFSSFLIGRLTNSDFNPYNACQYRFPAVLTDDSYPQTWAQAKNLFSAQPTSFPDDSPNDYAQTGLAAASMITDVTGGQAAYDFINTNIGATDKLKFIDNPKWAILPRSAEPYTGPGQTSYSGTGRSSFSGAGSTLVGD